MGNHKRAGFTIIETMLFLGVSGLLIVLLISGTGASINTQRYQDAAQSLKSLLQQQYADVNSVVNSRDDNWSCGDSATPSVSSTIKDNRGQSSCILIGKYVRLENEKISIYNVVAAKKASNSEDTDIKLLKSNYTLNISKDNVEQSVMEWGTRIAFPRPQTADSRKIGILIVRSPDSGQIYTFTNSDSSVPSDGNVGPASLANMLVSGTSVPGQGSRVICVDSGGMFASNDRAVVLLEYASTSGAVELQSNTMLKENGRNLQC